MMCFDHLPHDILQFIFLHYIDYPYIFICRSISKQLHQLIDKNFFIEIDHKEKILPPVFLKNYLHIKHQILQKRNSCLEWDDHRGFLIIVSIQQDQYDYYDHLLRHLFCGQFQRPSMYKGQILFYEYPL